MFSNGEPEKPLLIHVGRLGVEKSLDFLKRLVQWLWNLSLWNIILVCIAIL